MTTIIRGNANNLSVFADNGNGDTIILGNGINDFVSANLSQYDTIMQPRVHLNHGSGSAQFSLHNPLALRFIRYRRRVATRYDKLAANTILQ
jgi:hypothetical protein